MLIVSSVYGVNVGNVIMLYLYLQHKEKKKRSLTVISEPANQGWGLTCYTVISLLTLFHLQTHNIYIL